MAGVAVSGSFNDLADQPAPFDPDTLSTVAVSGSFNDLSNQPAPFDPSTLATVATTGAYSSLSGKPSLATVATTGAYSSLSGTPALITNTNQLTNGAGFVTAGGATQVSSLPSSGSAGDIVVLPNSLYYFWNVAKTAWERVIVDPAAGPNSVSGEAIITAIGSTIFTVPAGVYNLSVVAVGHGGRWAVADFLGSGAGGGALAYANGLAVEPAQLFEVIQPAADNGYASLGKTTIVRRPGGLSIVEVTGGQNSRNGYPNSAHVSGGIVIVGTGGNGGDSGFTQRNYSAGGSGGAGGYSGNGGTGGRITSSGSINGTNGSGGGGGGSGGNQNEQGYGIGGSGGGGVGLNGQGANGTGGANVVGVYGPSSYAYNGHGGSGGSDGPNVGANDSNTTPKSGLYGGGGGRGSHADGRQNGAVRFVWESGRSRHKLLPQH